MGNWRVTIEGHGVHHNGISTDAERIAAKAVAELRAAGHSITRADIDLITAYRPEYGSGENVEELAARLARPVPVVEAVPVAAAEPGLVGTAPVVERGAE